MPLYTSCELVVETTRSGPRLGSTPFRSELVEGGEDGDSATAANTADTIVPLLTGTGGGSRGASGRNGGASSSIVLSSADAHDTRRFIS